METREIFLVLGIEPTKEEELIKQAYRQKLVSVNPEDDPEGFKRLRQAYEEACRYARTQDTEGERDTSPVGLWMERVEDTYRPLSARVDEENWKNLFADEICVNLDTCVEAKKRFLTFLAEHYRFTTNVWRLIDETFAVRETKEELYDFLPKNFVDYLAYQCENGDWFPYDMLEGDDEADYDLFIRTFFDISRTMEDGKTEGVASLLDQADSLFISHPYMELERARYLLAVGKKEESLRLINEWVEKLGEEDERACYIAAGVYWGNGYKDKAAGYYNKLLETNPDHFLSNERLGEYYLEKEDYEAAKKHSIEAMKIGSTQELQELVHKINLVLIGQFKDKIKEEPDKLKNRLELGWCYLQEEDYDQGLCLFDGLSPDENDMEEYNNLMGKLYYAKENFDEALDYIKTWLNCLEQQNPEEEKEIRNRQTRISTAHTMMARIYRSWGEKDENYYHMALEEIDRASERGQQKFSYMMEKASLYMDWKKYEECAGICTDIIKEDSSYFPAYVTRQEAYYKMRDAHGVMEDFYSASEIYKGYPKMYELAAEVLMDFQKYEDLDRILEQAKENSVESGSLKIVRGKLMRLRAKTKTEAKEAAAYFEKLEEEFEKGEASSEDKAGVYCEIALCRELLDETNQALVMIDRAISQEPDNDRYIWIKANMLRNGERFEEALKYYRKYEEIHPDNDFDNLYYYIGECLTNMGKRTEGLKNYEKALELNPDHRRANNKIARIYTRVMEETGDSGYLERAVPYANRQLELTDEAYFYVERGLVYMAAGSWKEALADFQKAYELEPNNPYAYNNAGCVYKYKGEYEKAEEMLKKAVEVMGESESALPYGNLGDTYLRMGRFEDAAASYQENIKIFPKNRSNYRSLALVYRYQRRYQEALDTLRKIFGGNTTEFYREAEGIYVEMENYREAVECIKKLVKEKACGAGEAERMKAIVCMCREKYFQAELCLKKAYKESNGDEEEKRKTNSLIALFYHLKGDQRKAAQYATEAIEEQPKDYLDNQYHLKNSLFLIGKLYAYAGNPEKAREYFTRMEETGLCRGCSHTCCVHQLMAKALLMELDGDYKKAAELYEAAYKSDPNLLECRMLLKKMKK